MFVYMLYFFGRNANGHTSLKSLEHRRDYHKKVLLQSAKAASRGS